MSGMKLDLIWSPHHTNRFITVGSDIQLFEIEELKDGTAKSPGISVSDTTVANLLTVNSEYSYLKCVSWYPKAHHDHLLAIGLASGKVILNSFSDKTDDLSEFGAKEFLSKHSRPCNCLSWNPNDAKLLACGLEKSRVDNGLVVWDVTRPVYMENTNSMERYHAAIGMFPVEPQSVMKPYLELGGLSESYQSLQWFHHSANLIVSGMNNKFIKIYDTRDSTKPRNSTPTKAVYGVCVDPYFEHRLASVFENLFVLWDDRNFEKPVVTTHELKQISKISWCPTRSGLLAALIKDSNTIKLYDIQSPIGNNDEVEPATVERNIQPFESSNVVSFAWHPTQENRMITTAQNGIMRDYTVFDRITLNTSARSEIVWTYGKKVLHFINSNDKFYNSSDDISVTMQRRACQGYGLNMQQVWMNAQLSGDPSLIGVWVWLDVVKEYRFDKKSRSKSSLKYEGVHTIICGEIGLNNIDPKPCSTLSKSEQISVPWVGMNFAGSKMIKYVSDERQRALQLCGWGSDSDSRAFSSFLERLEGEGKYTRAACIAVFSLDIRKAIHILNQGAASKRNSGDAGANELNAIAMALAGYTEEKTGLWREISSSLKSALTDPYLRAMFAFLTEESGNYEEILNEFEIAVHDRLVVGLRYLPDKKLVEFLERLKTKMLEVGILDGILLTGLTNDGLSLIQQYVDRTADCQTASLIVLHTLPSHLSHNPRAQAWVEAYREFLDTWRLWKQRALFDVQWYKGSSVGNKPSQQIFLSCTFCGTSVLTFVKRAMSSSNNARFTQIQTTTAHSTKVTCCPGCRKPLPRCHLCLSRLGTPAGLHWKRPVIGKEEKKLTEFSNWITWCQSCRHGGHSLHMLGWFEEHNECPVTGCSCKCMSLDAVAKIGFGKEEKTLN